MQNGRPMERNPLGWMYHMYWWCKSKFTDKHLFTHCTSIWYKLLHNLEQWFVPNWKKSDILWIRGNLSKIDLLLKTKQISWAWNLKFHLRVITGKEKQIFLVLLSKKFEQSCNSTFFLNHRFTHSPSRKFRKFVLFLSFLENCHWVLQ